MVDIMVALWFHSLRNQDRVSVKRHASPALRVAVHRPRPDRTFLFPHADVEVIVDIRGQVKANAVRPGPPDAARSSAVRGRARQYPPTQS
jgi:hypothetical protein